MKILFVCLGNICRSPLAEGVMAHKLRQKGLDHLHKVDSCGTAAYHTGERPDPRSVEVARRAGVTLSSLARAVRIHDFEEYDLILAMDRSNLAQLQRMAKGEDQKAKIKLFRSFDPEAGTDLEVPDPYYGGKKGFEEVYNMVDRSCDGVLEYMEKRKNLD